MPNLSKLRVFIKLLALFVTLVSATPSLGRVQSHDAYLRENTSDSLLKKAEIPQSIRQVAQASSIRIQDDQASSQKQWKNHIRSISSDRDGLDSAQLRRISKKETAFTDSLIFVSKRYQETLNRYLEAALNQSSKESLDHFQAICKEQVSKHREELDKKMPALQDSLYTFTVLQYVGQLENDLLTSDKKFTPSDEVKALLVAATDKPEWSFTTSYSSRAVWQGLDQNDGKGSYSISAGYDHPSGFSATVSLLGLVGQQSVFDRTTLSASYQTELFKKLSVTGSYARYFYNDDSPELSASITDELSLITVYENPVLTPAVSVSYAFAGAGNDVFASLAIDHGFWIDNVFGGVMQIDPTVRADYALLESVTNQYALKISKLIGTRLSGKTLSSVSTSSSAFAITNYDFSLPVTYRYGCLELTPEITYTIPVNTSRFTNELNLVLDIKRRSGAGSEIIKRFQKAVEVNGSPIFYFSMSLSLIF